MERRTYEQYDCDVAEMPPMSEVRQNRPSSSENHHTDLSSTPPRRNNETPGERNEKSQNSKNTRLKTNETTAETVKVPEPPMQTRTRIIKPPDKLNL
jgi:ribosomal protein RSM22 (predicted rRNA methylase)